MALATSPEHPRADHRRAPAQALVSAILDASAAELGWLAWLDGPDPVVLRGEASSPLESTDIAEFPDPPPQPLVVDAGAASGPWDGWCRARGIQSCVIAPVLDQGRAVGTMGLASSREGTLGPSDARQLAVGSSLAVYPHARALAGARGAFSPPTTQVGVIVPFLAGARTRGVLILGEERRSRRQPLSPERIAILELVASRIAHILRISRRLEYERMAERRRQRQLTIERQRLAREVHDGVGQALSALLVQVRGAMTEGQAGPHDLQVLERTAVQAVDGARALAYGIRRLEGGIETLEKARSYAETMLHSVHCRLSWTEERTDLKDAGRVLREIARVIKESITNIVRRAKATSVRVRVEYPDGLIRVTIQDDGGSRGLGLVRSSERQARGGGTVDVRSARSGGGKIGLVRNRPD